MNKFDDLEFFLNYWLSSRPLFPPETTPTNQNGNLSGVVLYRDNEYQVQLFIVKPNSVIEPHIHPNVDSFEVYVSGDIRFMCDDIWYDEPQSGQVIRVKPNSYHGGEFGERGGCFLSVQKWLNGVPPTSVGDDWHDKQGNAEGTASDSGDAK
jgi:quercetin dioxygenase-like cupin family protein